MAASAQETTDAVKAALDDDREPRAQELARILRRSLNLKTPISP
jgi:hypothetical protein